MALLTQVPLVERSGRRPLLMGGMTGMAISAVIITVALNLQSTVSWMAYISIICIITFVIGFAIGLGKSRSQVTLCRHISMQPKRT